MREQLVALFEANHKLVEPGALELLLESSQPLALSREVLARLDVQAPFVTAEIVSGVLARVRAVREAPNLAGAQAPAPPVPAAFTLLHEGFSPPTADEPLGAYRGLFTARFRALSRLLKGRSDLPNLEPAKSVGRRDGTVSVIGLVREIRRSVESKNVVLTIEDESGPIELFVPRDIAAPMALLNDEVVGARMVVGREKGRLPRAQALVRPDVPLGVARRRADGPSAVLFLSDLHIGSRSFLAESWAALVEFLKGHGAHPELAVQVDHVVIAGDLVDGIGIYPNQERDLAIHDIFEQYRELARRLKELPERLSIIVVPGNHDAVCPAEPQPALPPEIRSMLPANVRAVGNPSTFALHGVVVEAYHGRSFDDLIPAIPGATYARPTEVMKQMLKMRHLAPIYGGRTPLAPLPRDGLVIDPAPDILVTGHAHTYGVDQYRGVMLLNASTWQAETEYQRMRNIAPVPARAAVVRLSDLTMETLDVSDPRRATVALAAS